VIRLRSPQTGKQVELSAGTCVEITDNQGNIALLIRADARGVVQLITAHEEPDIAAIYARQFGVHFSRLVTPDLSTLQHPTPQPFNSPP
jgi:hypothetical protein